MYKAENMRFRIYFLVFFILLVGASCQKEHGQPPESCRPNVLFIAVDDLRPMLGSYGVPYIKTPNIDRLSAEGTVFERAYCNVPVCGASRASLLTGLRPSSHRFLDYYTRAEEDAPGVTSLPAHFKNNGYYTISLGKIFHHMDDMKESWSEEPWRAAYTGPNGERSIARYYFQDVNKQLQARPGKRGPSYEMSEAPDSVYLDGQMTQKAISKLKELSQMDTSFFLAMGYLRPHLPFNAPKKYWDMYPPGSVTLAENTYWPSDAPREGWYGTGELRKYHGVPSGGPIPDSLARKLVHGYQACVSYVDALIGQVLNTLKETGLDRNTIVVLWGDHGYLLGEHRLWCKHITFEKALHVPLLISAPGYRPGQHTRQLVEYLDLYPTLCDLVGLSQPSHLAGKSLVPLLKDPGSAGKEFITARYLDMEAIKTDKFLYTEWVDSAGRILDRMLYDHDNDPNENVNVAEQPGYRETVEELSKKLKMVRTAGSENLPK